MRNIIIFCPNCGAKIAIDPDDLHQFCFKCGAKLPISVTRGGAIEDPDSFVSEYLSPEEERFYRDMSENTMANRQARVNAILRSSKTLIEKLKALAYNPYSDCNILSYLLKNGPKIINIMDTNALVDRQGNTFLDFIESDTQEYIFAIRDILKELKMPQNAALWKKHESYLRAADRAVTIWEDLLEISQDGYLLIDGSCDHQYLEDDGYSYEDLAAAFTLMQKFIQSNADYEMAKVADKGAFDKLKYRRAVDRYVAEQMHVLHEYYRKNVRNVGAVKKLVDWGND